MDKLKNSDGYSLVEALVSLLLLSMLIVFTINFFLSVLDRPGFFLKLEASNAALAEIKHCRSVKAVNDSTYKNIKGNLIIERYIEKTGSMIKAVVKVKPEKLNKDIVSMQVTYYAFNN